MKRTVSTADLIANAGEIIEAVHEKGEVYVISSDGKASAAIVPLEVVERLEMNRQRLYESIMALREASAGCDPDEIRAAIDETVADVRRERRERRMREAQESQQ